MCLALYSSHLVVLLCSKGWVGILPTCHYFPSYPIVRRGWVRKFKWHRWVGVHRTKNDQRRWNSGIVIQAGLHSVRYCVSFALHQTCTLTTLSGCVQQRVHNYRWAIRLPLSEQIQSETDRPQQHSMENETKGAEGVKGGRGLGFVSNSDMGLSTWFWGWQALKLILICRISLSKFTNNFFVQHILDIETTSGPQQILAIMVITVWRRYLHSTKMSFGIGN